VPAAINSTASPPTVRGGIRRPVLKGRRIAPYLFLAPTLFFFAIFFLLPIGFSLYLAFTNWNPLSTPSFIGLRNFQYVLTRDPYFFSTLRNTFVFAFGTVCFGVPLALVLAFVFSRSRGKAVWRTLYWLPMVTNVAAIAYLWRFMLDGTYGMLNTLLARVGIVGPQWLDDPLTAMIAVIVVAVWTGLGGNMIIFSAGLEGIAEVYYEAARIDGASAVQEFWNVTLPLLRPTLLFVSVTSFIAGLSSFALIMVMTGGGPAQSTNVTANYMYQVAFQDLRMGRASAMAYLLFVVILVVTLIQLRVFRRGGVEAY
jgi:multiple sugar transport system permease protein